MLQYLFRLDYQYYPTMSEKHNKWRQAKTPTKRLNNIMEKKELPDRFRPTRDRSESIDKIFNGSRSRVHSEASMQITNLNQTKVEDGILGDRTVSRINDQKEEMISNLRKQIMRLNTLQLGGKKSTGPIGAEGVVRSNQLLAQLKKQFNNFKQNVLKELNRQMQLVNQLIKEVVLTLEYELEKLGRKPGPEDFSNINSCNSTNFESLEAKTIEQWKKNLQHVDLSAPNNMILPDKLPTMKTDDKGKKEQLLLPPDRQIDVSGLISSIAKMNQRVAEMEMIIAPPGGSGPGILNSKV